VDPPFVDQGVKYKHNAGQSATEQEAWHACLAKALARFREARVVLRCYNHPLMRALYPEARWTWRFLDGRNQRNNVTAEVLILNGASRAKSAVTLF
jgi:hypothetical protein